MSPISGSFILVHPTAHGCEERHHGSHGGLLLGICGGLRVSVWRRLFLTGFAPLLRSGRGNAFPTLVFSFRQLDSELRILSKREAMCVCFAQIMPSDGQNMKMNMAVATLAMQRQGCCNWRSITCDMKEAVPQERLPNRH